MYIQLYLERRGTIPNRLNWIYINGAVGIGILFTALYSTLLVSSPTVAETTLLIYILPMYILYRISKYNTPPSH